MDFDELEALIRPNIRLIVINTPSNPTGYTFSNEELKVLCRIAAKHGIYLFSDEVYKGLELDGEPRAWAADLYERAMSLGVLSKAHGLPGLRIGWLAGQDRALLEKIRRYKHYLSICCAAPAEQLAMVALKHSDRFLAHNVQIIRENLAFANDFFARHDDLFINHPPQCGPIAFHQLKYRDSADDFCHRLVTETGILLLPGSKYDYTEPFFRMGYGRKNMQENLGKLEQYLNR